MPVPFARIKESLDPTFGLDLAAFEAALQAGSLNGLPVPVLVTLNLEFRLEIGSSLFPTGLT